MRGQAGLDKIRVDKAQLLATLKENRDAHRDQFEQALVIYRQRVIRALDERLTDAREGGPIRLHIGLPTPEDFTTHYDEAIAQLDWSLDDEVELDQQTFSQLVLNNWEWAQRFAANTSSYLAE